MEGPIGLRQHQFSLILRHAVVWSLLHITAVLSDTFIRTHNITAAVGSDVTLQCEIVSASAKVSQVNWDMCNGVHIAYFANDFKPEGKVDDAFLERVALADEFGITILSVNASDTGQYCCIFNTYPNGKFIGKIFLTVTVTKSKQWTYLYYVCVGMPLVTLILCVIGIGIYCYKRKSRQTRSTRNLNQYIQSPPGLMMPNQSPLGTSRAVQGYRNENEQEYFNVMMYKSLTCLQNSGQED